MFHCLSSVSHFFNFSPLSDSKYTSLPFSQHLSKYPNILICTIKVQSPIPPHPHPPSPICCWAVKLLRKRSVNLLSKPQAEGLHSSPSTQRAVYLHPCTLLPWQPPPNTLACSTLFNFFLPFFLFHHWAPMLTLPKINRDGARSQPNLHEFILSLRPVQSMTLFRHPSHFSQLEILENAQRLWGRGDLSWGLSWLGSSET